MRPPYAIRTQGAPDSTTNSVVPALRSPSKPEREPLGDRKILDE